MLQDVHAKTRVFFDKIEMLPLLDFKVLRRQIGLTEKLFVKVTQVIEKHSSGFAALRFIQPRLPEDLVHQMIAHFEQSEDTSSTGSSSTGTRGTKRPRS